MSATNHTARTNADGHRRPAPNDPRTMRAVVQTGYGPPERVLRLDRISPPPVADDDVLIRVHATSVNTPDWLTVTGVPYVLRARSGLRRPAAPVRGSDVAGVVEAVGANVTSVEPGDEVFGSSWNNSLTDQAGTFAELTVAPASQLITKPAGLSHHEAAASVMSGLTALIGMRDVARVGPGMRVLINGASGGVGTFAVQIATAFGGHVTGVCSTTNVDLVRSLGADHVIDYTQQDFTRGDERYDVILDNVMNHPPTATARMLTPTGLLIPNSVGNTDGVVGSLLGGLPRIARATLMGRGSTRVSAITCDVTQANLHALAELLESGDVRAVIDSVHPLEQAGAAVARMLGHHARGNVVITV